MEWISDNAIRRLQHAADLPDLSGTKYAIRETLGRGGMGVVYLAEDTELQREVALKVLRGPTLDADATRRMLREARIIARLEHPGIVPIHDAGTLPDGRPFYVMKLVRGRRLDEPRNGEAAELAERLRLFERICETVAFAHAHGVVHRDLKPQNVMVGAFGEVLVLDWGVAKLLQSAPSETEPRASARANPPAAHDAPALPECEPRASARADAASQRRPHVLRDQAVSSENPAGMGSGEDALPTAALSPPGHDIEPAGSARAQARGSQADIDGDATLTRRTLRGTVIGTPAYMPPEQARGDVDAVDQRSDVYALGAILYYLLTDQPPSPAVTAANVHALPASGILAPRSLNPATPRPLDAVCRKAMHADPAERYASADALAAEVGRFLAGRRVAAYPENILGRIGRVLWKYRTFVALILAYLVMRILLIFFGSL